MFTEGKQTRAIRVEEIHHAITQIGYGKAYPKIFATDNGWSGTSTLVKECKKARCDWWQHPENSCTSKKPILPRLSCMKTHASQPGALYPGNGGSKCSTSQAKATCDYSSCDCIEWFHQVTIQLDNEDAKLFFHLFYSITDFNATHILYMHRLHCFMLDKHPRGSLQLEKRPD